MPIVVTEGLTKVYGEGEMSVTALDSVDISVEPGEFVAIMGPSGCGKSTLLNLVGGLDRPSSGRVLIDGADLTTLDDDKLTELRRRHMGFIFQFYNLIPVLDATENAALPLTLDGAPHAADHAREWLTKVGLGDRMSNRPDQLSGGQQQRVARDHEDSKAATEIATLLGQVSSQWGRAVLMVTHDPRIASFAKRLLLMKDGAIVDDLPLDGDGGEAARKAMEKAGLL
jgi:putative ABC transport system ATP-binding protein